MKITDLKIIVTCPGRNYVLLKIMTDEAGLYGVGEATLNGSESIVAEALRHIAHLLIGRDPQRIEDTWNLVYRQGYWRGGPIFMAALAAIDMALWDIKGKQANLPVYQLLGGKAREGVLVYRHAFGRDAVECEDSVRSWVAQNYKVVRVQMGPYGGAGMMGEQPPLSPGTPPTGIYEPTPYLLSVPRLFAHLRDKLGMELELLHDVHEQLQPIEAARLAKDLEPYRLFFLEDPLMPEHRESWPIVRAASVTPLAMGEIFTSRWDCLPLFLNKWIDFIRICPLHIGGISEARKILTLAEPFNVRSAFHGAADMGPIAQSASVSLQTVVPNFGIQEWTDYTEATHEVMPGACQIRDGYALPNEAPGLGLDINEEAAAKYPYQRQFMPLVRRADGSMHVY